MKNNDFKIKPGKTVIQKIIYLSLSEQERSELYRPYLYGPFSEKVQELLENLILNDSINYDFKKGGYSFINKRKENKIADNVNKKIDKVIDYLHKKGIKNSEEISNFAKVFMIQNNNKDINDDRLAGFIKKRSKFLGWDRLAKKNNSNINELIKSSKEFSCYVRS